MDTRKGRYRYCPNCKKILETRVLLEGYSQVPVHGILAKRRQVVCGTDEVGSGGCGTKWFTLEILEDQVLGSGGERGQIRKRLKKRFKKGPIYSDKDMWRY